MATLSATTSKELKDMSSIHPSHQTYHTLANILSSRRIPSTTVNSIRLFEQHSYSARWHRQPRPQHYTVKWHRQHQESQPEHHHNHPEHHHNQPQYHQDHP
jgi:hypothetical protein